ncbi:MAG: helix-turn-helix domain-containing protein [Clostridiales bacterium]|nr:helix-turn-helix domain-containing protein [Candidatus Equinaster intestinalis]
MNNYITGAMIKRLREEKGLTQSALADLLGVSGKAVSKWETGKGYPDISLIEPIAKILGISVIELMAGNETKNLNRSFNMKRIKIYVCPVCGNIITAVGDVVVSCCGITLPCLEPEEADGEHLLIVSDSEDEYYVTLNHEMSKEHYISFIIAVKDDRADIYKLYPESAAEARFKKNKTEYFYFYCKKHGLFKQKI